MNYVQFSMTTTWGLALVLTLIGPFATCLAEDRKDIATKQTAVDVDKDGEIDVFMTRYFVGSELILTDHREVKNESRIVTFYSKGDALAFHEYHDGATLPYRITVMSPTEKGRILSIETLEEKTGKYVAISAQGRAAQQKSFQEMEAFWSKRLPPKVAEGDNR